MSPCNVYKKHVKRYNAIKLPFTVIAERFMQNALLFNWHLQNSEFPRRNNMVKVQNIRRKRMQWNKLDRKKGDVTKRSSEICKNTQGQELAV